MSVSTKRTLAKVERGARAKSFIALQPICHHLFSQYHVACSFSPPDATEGRQSRWLFQPQSRSPRGRRDKTRGRCAPPLSERKASAVHVASSKTARARSSAA